MRMTAGLALIEALFAVLSVPNPVTVEEALAHCEALVRSPALTIRLQAGRTLGTLLRSLRDKVHTDHSSPLWESFQEAAMSDLRSPNIANIHGGILTLQQLAILGIPTVRRIFEQLMQACFTFFDHRDICVRQAAIDLVSDAVHCNPEVFVKDHLELWLVRMLVALGDPNDRSAALEALGVIAVETKESLIPFLPVICEGLMRTATGVVKKGGAIDAAFLDAIENLAMSIGAPFERPGRHLVRMLLSVEPSQKLFSALHRITAKLTNLWPLVEDQLIELTESLITDKEPMERVLIGLGAIEMFSFSGNSGNQTNPL